MSPEDITKAIDEAIRQHELRVALWSGLLGPSAYGRHLARHLAMPLVAWWEGRW
jgi:hypothetical protein